MVMNLVFFPMTIEKTLKALGIVDVEATAGVICRGGRGWVDGDHECRRCSMNTVDASFPKNTRKLLEKCVN